MNRNAVSLLEHMRTGTHRKCDLDAEAVPECFSGGRGRVHDAQAATVLIFGAASLDLGVRIYRLEATDRLCVAVHELGH